MAFTKKATSNDGAMSKGHSLFWPSASIKPLFIFLSRTALLLSLLTSQQGRCHRIAYDPLKDPDYWQGPEMFTDMERTNLQQYTQNTADGGTKHYVFPEFVKQKLEAEISQRHATAAVLQHQETKLTEIHAPNTKESSADVVKTRRKRVHIVNTEQDKAKVVKMIKRMRKKKKMKKKLKEITVASNVAPLVDDEEAELARADDDDDDIDTSISSSADDIPAVTYDVASVSSSKKHNTGLEVDAPDGIEVNAVYFVPSSASKRKKVQTTTTSLVIDSEPVSFTNTDKHIRPTPVSTVGDTTTTTASMITSTISSTISDTTSPPQTTMTEPPSTSMATTAAKEKTLITHLTKRETEMTLSANSVKDGTEANMKIFLAVQTTPASSVELKGKVPVLMSLGQHGGAKQAAGAAQDGKSTTIFQHTMVTRSPSNNAGPAGEQNLKKVVVALVDGDSQRNLSDYFGNNHYFAAGAAPNGQSSGGGEVVFRVVPAAAGNEVIISTSSPSPATGLSSATPPEPAHPHTWRILATATWNEEAMSGNNNRQISTSGPNVRSAAAGMPEEARRLVYMTADNPPVLTTAEQPPTATKAKPNNKEGDNKEKGKFLIDSSEILKILMRQAFPQGLVDKKTLATSLASTKGTLSPNFQPIPAQAPVNGIPPNSMHKFSNLMQVLEQHLKAQKGTKAEKSLLRLYSALSLKFQNHTTSTTTTTTPSSSTPILYQVLSTTTAKAMAAPLPPPAMVDIPNSPAWRSAPVMPADGMGDPDATSSKDTPGQSSGEQNKLDPILHMSQRTLDFMKQLLRKNKFDSMVGRSVGSFEPINLMPTDRAPKPSFVNVLSKSHLFEKSKLSGLGPPAAASSSLTRFQPAMRKAPQLSQSAALDSNNQGQAPVSNNYQQQRSAATAESQQNAGIPSQLQYQMAPPAPNPPPVGDMSNTNYQHIQQQQPPGSLVDNALEASRQNPGASVIPGSPQQQQAPISLQNLMQSSMDSAAGLLQRRPNPMALMSEGKPMRSSGAAEDILSGLSLSKPARLTADDILSQHHQAQQQQSVNLFADPSHNKEHSMAAIINEKTVNVHFPLGSGGAPELLQELFPTKTPQSGLDDNHNNGMDGNRLLGDLIKDHLLANDATVVRPAGHLDPALIDPAGGETSMFGSRDASLNKHQSRNNKLASFAGDALGFVANKLCPPNEVCVSSYQKPDGTWVQEQVASFGNEDQNGALIASIDPSVSSSQQQGNNNEGSVMRIKDLEFHPEPGFYREVHHEIQPPAGNNNEGGLNQDGTQQQQQAQQVAASVAAVFGMGGGDAAAESSLSQQQPVNLMQRRSDLSSQQQQEVLDALQINAMEGGQDQQHQQLVSEVCDHHQHSCPHQQQRSPAAGEQMMYNVPHHQHVHQVEALDPNNLIHMEQQHANHEDGGGGQPHMVVNVLGQGHGGIRTRSVHGRSHQQPLQGNAKNSMMMAELGLASLLQK